MFEAGTYYGRIKADDAKTGEAGTGNAQLVIPFFVSHRAGPDGGWVQVAEEERTLYIHLTDAAWTHSEKKLLALEFNGDFSNPKFGDRFYTEGLEFICKVETYKNKPQEKWELANWGGEVKPASADVIRRLNSLWKGNTAAAKPAGRPTPPPSSGATSRPAAPAASRPPAPSSNGAATATATLTVTTKDQAWARLLEAYEGKGKTDQELSTIFLGCVETVAKSSGKVEADFQAAQWADVAEEVVIPF